jgi:hypothetical protein
MAKLLRSGESFISALSRIHEIMEKGSFDPEELKELEMLKWLVLEYEEKYNCYNPTENNYEPFPALQQYKIAF